MGSLLLALIYICFISLGLPDSLLGSAWPVLHTELGVPVSYAGIISMVIYLGTIISSLFSERLLRRFGSGLVTATSIFITALALLGFSLSHSFVELILWAIPYGLGAGGVDAILNNYVALHYKAQHMSWLHCMWGVGASISPYIMSFSLIRLNSWERGYFIVFLIQAVLSVIVFASVPIWKKSEDDGDKPKAPLTFKQIFSIKGSALCFLAFFAYCSLELSASLWASSYLVQDRGLSPEDAARGASMFFIGITFGRFLNGFLAMKLSDKTLIRIGCCVISVGIALLFVPMQYTALAAFAVTGLGCAPIYPCIIHMTPSIFGRENSRAMIGVQMAFAYLGFLIMPPLFGFLSDYVGMSLLPVYLALLLIFMFIMHELVLKKAEK